MRHTQPAIASVIQFCSHDWRFLNACIEQARYFSKQIYVVMSDHFFDGTPENFSYLEKLFARYPDCLFIEFAYTEPFPYGHFASLNREDRDFVHQWHSVGRMIPWYFLDPAIEHVLFVDADEVLDGTAFREWLNVFPYREYAALRLSSYYYFREARYRATQWSEAALLLKRESAGQNWSPSFLLDPDERMGIFNKIRGQKLAAVHGLDEKPMMHHYSWVRTKEEMLQKTKRWGHHWERNWPQLIEEEFSRPFNGSDFVRKYRYIETEAAFDPLQIACETENVAPKKLEEHLACLASFPNVIRVDPPTFFRRALAYEFNL